MPSQKPSRQFLTQGARSRLTLPFILAEHHECFLEARLTIPFRIIRHKVAVMVHQGIALRLDPSPIEVRLWTRLLARFIAQLLARRRRCHREIPTLVTLNIETSHETLPMPVRQVQV